MAKVNKQVSNESFDLSYSYHDKSFVLTYFLENGDEDRLLITEDQLDDFLEICETVSLLRIDGEYNDD